MNKREKTIFSENTTYYMGNKQLRQLEEATIDFDNKKIILKQNKDITITEYEFIVVASNENAPIYEILFECDGAWQKIEPGDQNHLGHYNWGRVIEGEFWKIDLSFNTKYNKIKFVYKNDMVDPIILEVDYQEADKKAYYKKLNKEKREELISHMSLNIRTGHDLVNIFWQNATKTVKKTRVELFLNLDGSQRFLTIDLDENTFYKSITGLAYGYYYCRVSQFDDNGNLIVASDMMSFHIEDETFIAGEFSY